VDGTGGALISLLLTLNDTPILDVFRRCNPPLCGMGREHLDCKAYGTALSP